MSILQRHYDRVWCPDFEYGTGDSRADAPTPRCMVAIDYLSGDKIELWLDGRTPRCPLSLDDRSLYVAFYAPAEISCHESLGWPRPQRVLDLYAELRWLLNGVSVPILDELKKHNIGKHSFLAALHYFGLSEVAVTADYKADSQQLALRGGPYSPEEQRALLDYNRTDAVALVRLLEKMLPHIELPQALLRGRYMSAAGVVQHTGIPVEGSMVSRLKDNWGPIVDRLIEKEHDRFDVITGDDGFGRDVDQDKFASWLLGHGIEAWPHTSTGLLDTSSNTLSDWAKFYPQVMELKEFLHAVRQTRLFADLAIGDDARNRFLLSPFASKTGRNQPSSSKGVFGPATWVRSIIQPEPGDALLYADFSGQEYGIAAFLSGDPAMIADYRGGDPYLGFAKRMGLVPANATKKTHRTVRDQLKVAAGLGVLYGAGQETVARAGGMTPTLAKRILQHHRWTYPKFWRWRQAIVDHAMIHGELRTTFGWRWLIREDDTARSISNFPMQGNGAEQLRLAMCLAVERGLRVCCPVHDALLVECAEDALDDAREALVACMVEASAEVLGNGELRVGVEPPICWPDRYVDSRGVQAWGQIMGLLREVEKPQQWGQQVSA